jgi:hypothetical protein
MVERIIFKKYDKTRYSVVNYPNNIQLHVYWVEGDKGLRFDVYENYNFSHSLTTKNGGCVYDRIAADNILKEAEKDSNYLKK